MKNNRIRVPVCTIFFVTLSLLSGAASAISLVGDQVNGALSSGFGQTLLSPFSSPATIIDPGIEFIGELQASPSLWDGEQYNVIVDIYNDHFTVTSQASNDWGVVGGFGVGTRPTLLRCIT